MIDTDRSEQWRVRISSIKADIRQLGNEIAAHLPIDCDVRVRLTQAINKLTDAQAEIYAITETTSEVQS